MKFNWKVLVGLVVVIAVAFWGVDSLRTRSYSGTELNFAVGGGPVTVTNPSDAPIAVQFVGAGTRSFAMSSSIDGAAGSSTREGSGNTSTQRIEFALPPGVSELTITRGTDVHFVASADSRLEAVVQPVTADDAQTTLIALVVVILGALFYMSNATGHAWMKLIRRNKASAPIAQPSPAAPESPAAAARRA